MTSSLGLKPGSAAWLLMHECRLAFYDLGDSKNGSKSRRGMSAFGIGLIGLVYIAIHVSLWFMLRKIPAFGSEIPDFVLMGTGLVMLLLSSFMLSFGLTRSVKALFERGDLDLLLSSPLSSKTIFIVRLAGVTFSAGIWFFALLTPLAHVGLLLGQWRWLSIYPVLLSMAMLAAACSMMLTLALVKSIGVRKTATAGQILSALAGASIFILSQLFGNLGQDVRASLLQHIMPWVQPGGILDGSSPLWLPARALFGSWSALLALLLFSVLCFWLTAQSAHRFFILGVQQAVGNPRSSVNAAKPASLRQAARFGRSLQTTILLKEWRLISRDPNLISQVLLQILYIAPLFFLIFKSQAILPGVASGLVFLSSSLAGSLIWIIVAAEDAPDLLRAAPVKSQDILFSKLLAAILPVLLLTAPVLVWLLIQQWQLGLLVLACSLAGMLSSALIHLWQSKPATRTQFNKRGQTQLLAGLLEAATSFSWAACIYTGMKHPSWIWIPVLCAALALGVSWLSRIERNP